MVEVPGKSRLAKPSRIWPMPSSSTAPVSCQRMQYRHHFITVLRRVIDPAQLNTAHFLNSSSKPQDQTSNSYVLPAFANNILALHNRLLMSAMDFSVLVDAVVIYFPLFYFIFFNVIDKLYSYNSTLFISEHASKRSSEISRAIIMPRTF
jgi:hypothetical protein